MRKHLLLLGFILVMASCSTKYPVVRESSIIDYSSFEKEGFFLSESNSVNFPYAAIGSVSALVLDGWEVTGIIKENRFSDEIVSGDRTKYGMFIRATPNDVLNELYNRATQKDANGIINLSIEPMTKEIKGRGIVKGFYAKGMAIKK